jgi:hypothetical protein
MIYIMTLRLQLPRRLVLSNTRFVDDYCNYSSSQLSNDTKHTATGSEKRINSIKRTILAHFILLLLITTNRTRHPSSALSHFVSLPISQIHRLNSHSNLSISLHTTELKSLLSPTIITAELRAEHPCFQIPRVCRLKCAGLTVS